MACPITVAKFVGTISLGLLTGLSYSVSTIAIPALLALPSASSAARTLKDIQSRTRKHVIALSQITAISLLTAFTLSSPRRRHPYLIWTGLMSLIGGGGLEWWYGRSSLPWSFFTTWSWSLDGSSATFSSSASGTGFGVGSWVITGLGGNSSTAAPTRTQEDEESSSSGNGSEIEIVEGEEAEAAAAAAPETATPTEAAINGETVKQDMENERKFQRLRTWVVGLGFSMGVVGIWGDRM
ncbi:hypothetical protein AJ80_08033 [Polytolypa hystricis UAMH7299]|uniref:Autophagy-related protein 33 n=1 Tax=Polytolypa hystricis (strain UAMH7299) TaxID=1447883 RepID=A0A2B7XF17_POLH7|nr:hypothetical protein AJ80_08033 [Polytolypa hystricis UAMH7299]